MIFNLAANRLNVRSEARSRNHSGVKIAISAFGLTERDLHVDAKDGHLHKNFNTAAHRAPRWEARDSGRVRNDFYVEVAVARAVKFAKENPLPAPKL